MIQEQEAALLINKEIIFNEEENNASVQKSLYQLFGQLNAALKKQVINQNFPTLKHSLAVIEKLYAEGNSKIQHCVENIIVFSFFDFVSLQTKDCRQKVHALFPIGIYSAYIRQVNTSAY
ncbi:MAG: hypothetical protein H7Y86_08795 [Rhizobacter sp.]|nr:hypothetical protein [Ferruginibacter sp.]